MYRLILDEFRGCRGEISTPRSAQPFILINGRDSQCCGENVDNMANMATLSVYHPDIREFIHAKSKDPNRLNHFNLSVLVDDDFMEAVEEDKTVKLHWPIFDENNIPLSEEKWDSRCTKEISARELWDEIMEMAYNTGEPKHNWVL